jgi:AcrR family transcriptional regulator
LAENSVSDKRSLRKAKTRQAIKDAALEIAESEGWGGVTIRKIADRVNYTAPIVYEYFEGKDDLYHQLVHDGFEKLATGTMEFISEVDDPQEKLIRMAEVRFNFAIQNPTLHHLMFDSENPQWQQLEMDRSMLGMKQLVDNLILEISGDRQRANEYIFNLICLIKGYTFFANHLMNSSSKMKKHFSSDRDVLNRNFTNAIRRFIQSIQQT